MILLDVNILIYAHRRDLVEHERYRRWLTNVLLADEPYGMSELVLSSIVANSDQPPHFPIAESSGGRHAFAEHLLAQPNCTPIWPGSRHWPIFARLCREAEATGPLVPDAFFAALAIEHACEWITADRDYARFKGLRWRHPLAT